MSDGPAGSPRLSDRQRLNWLRLIRTENVGPAAFRDLINRFGSAEAALDFLPELAVRGGAARMPRIPGDAEVEREMEACRKAGARFIALGEADYPPMLKRMDLPPPLVAVKGQPAVLHLTAIGIVGARNASLAGIRMARTLAAELGRNELAIISGLARGIDAAAHAASLDTGTVAVLAGGIDKPYPPENLELCAKIAERGCLISEMPFGWEPRARDFPRRNRLIAGLSLGVVVVEAAKRSGSLITARLANEMGRLVFAVPGSPLDPRASGTNGLLKDGALLVTEYADVLDAIAPLTGTTRSIPPSVAEPPDFGAVAPPDEPERDRVLEALSPVPAPVDDVIRHTGLHPAQVFMILLELDLAGRLERHPGGSVSLAALDP
jgi:DNA processing protein